MNDLDAPTTVPQTPTTSSLVERIGAVVAQPVRALRALERDEAAHPLEPLGVYAVVVLALHAAETYRGLALATEAPLIAVRRLLDVVWRAGRTDIAVVVGAAVVAALAGWWLRRRQPLPVFIAVTYLGIHLALWKALGGLVSLAGLEAWWLPHTAVDSMAVVVSGHVDWARFVGKCVVSYGSGLVVLVLWLKGLVSPATAPSGPRAIIARRGAAVALVIVVTLASSAGVFVYGRRDALRPRLRGDVFPALALPHIETGTRTDPTDALDAGAKILIVDFWASWCGPCKRSLPELSQIAAEYRSRGVVIIGVNREPTDQAAARAAWKAMAPSFESLVDTVGLGERLGLSSLPTSYVIDSAGRIRAVHLGYISPDTIRRELDAMLAGDGHSATR